MFRIEAFVDDAKLVKTLKSLTGLVYDLKTVPVDFQDVTDGSSSQGSSTRRSSVNPSGQSAPAFLAGFLDLKLQHKLDTVRTDEMTGAGSSAGHSKAAIYAAIKKATSSTPRLLTRISQGNYRIHHTDKE